MDGSMNLEEREDLSKTIEVSQIPRHEIEQQQTPSL